MALLVVVPPSQAVGLFENGQVSTFELLHQARREPMKKITIRKTESVKLTSSAQPLYGSSCNRFLL